MCRISFFLNFFDQNNILKIHLVYMFIIFYIFFEFSTSYCGSSIFKIISWPFCELKNLLKFSLTIFSLFNNFSKSISSSFSFSFFISFLFLISLLLIFLLFWLFWSPFILVFLFSILLSTILSSLLLLINISKEILTVYTH